MASVVINGDTSGSVTLQAPAAAGATVLTLPSTSGTIVITSGAQTIEFADGSASAPSITNSGDTNTGIFFPAADTIAFAEGGVEAMRIDSSGNVGIGTTSPSTWGKFAVVGASSGGQVVAAIANTSGTANTQAVLSLDTANAGFNVRDSQIRATNNGLNQTTLEFYTANAATPTEKMRIDSSGNVGIGTTSVLAATKLDVRGAISAYDGGTQEVRLNTEGNIEISRSDGVPFIDFKSSTAEDYDCRIQQVSNGLTFQTGGNGSASERMRIDSAGNVGIGTSSPTTSLFVNRAASGHAATFYSNGGGVTTGFNTFGITLTGNLSNGAAECNIVYGTGGAGLAFNSWNGTTQTERMRIDSSGTVIIGKSTTDITTVGSYITGTSGLHTTFTISSGTNEMSIYNNTSTGGNARFDFRVANVSKGYIQWNNTNTTYSTTSDYRLKENIASMTGALDIVAQLNPVTYNWKADGSNGQGFIAHELQEVVPDCVTGEKDAVDEEGNPKYQGIDTSFLVATLTAAIQEQQTIINDLKARIETLENK